jgi:hypothetical protein
LKLTKEYLAMYYQDFFPSELMYQWLSYESGTLFKNYFKKQITSFPLSNSISEGESFHLQS